MATVTETAAEPRPAMDDPAHPGEVLREYLPKGVALGEMASRLGVTRQALSALLNGRAGVSATMALRLEAVLGTSAQMWLDMQTGYDLSLARRRPPTIGNREAERAGQGSVISASSITKQISDLQPSIAVLCERHGVRELSLFGSVLRDDFDPESSDIDAVVTFGPPIGESLVRQYFDFKQDLEALFARPVDLVELDAMPDTRLKRIIERSKRTVYAAAA